jgi:Bacterial transcriptional activator domain
VVADLGRLAAEHPLQEESWRLLALALCQHRRQGDALAASRTRLAAELGVNPALLLGMLESGVLAQASQWPPPPRFQATPACRSLPPMALAGSAAWGCWCGPARGAPAADPSLAPPSAVTAGRDRP